ncbi:MAG: M23 family metallopeptidase [Treponema sp.]|nr:M23 family metallopeptidase [Treponema sp.]
MEIINFVQEPRGRSSSRFYRKTIGSVKINRTIRKSRDNSVSFDFSFPNEKNVFKAGKVKNPFKVKDIFIWIGKELTATGRFISKNIKKILISLLCVLFSLAVVGGAGYFYLYKMYHTGPVDLFMEDSVEIENLNKFMSKFALEPSSDVDAEGNLLNGMEAILMNQIFTQPVSYQNYKVKSGDTISGITKKFGLSNISTLISVNDISNVRQLAAGQKLKVPSMDGVVYTVQKGDSIASIALKYSVKLESLLDVNELTNEELTVGQVLFIPGVALDRKTLQNAMGELFILPISASFRWTSPYGWREDPISFVRSFHTGTDMACPQGTPILASQSGRISTVGFNRIYGNYIIIDHGNGYQTLYAHMYKAIAKKGQWVSQGTRIGLVGSTGYSTGPHLHFMVYKNGNRIDPMSVLKR